ncbi:MAG: pyridoxamine 5'-phosphate oxidase [Thiobacillus sp. 63-78]|uniref:pyridoxamine 5'-phosphate oxidase family protein n=1 Tax=Thiobacillus sp. 63-78 TaxID=1895859 RepID=UPI00086E587E|nr:pyridoxamine 5'-phosphate oxidase family protein [Thiobacillus sp. 63-78]MBN8763135.1 pyridoxamine 5'-phosphate oxidase family protein [Thiobacillus sp.]ODV12233.1 MAG: pyridoxamine 5'-phosphate oxidase [Thiobacillus sp. SCN 64-317]MBN8766628.1 pyridoxamine 5'-phosphate oxidase family protein [Thiobacillus sp.]MBN8774744.1 pyridoxamine 5'-phosphate oxidase family protein [Thiobacillus sp.]OJZ11726.1 MAG: pyridoxamine 5'-phosphate oxidase [Thiobacillus sp. 63-78]
MARFYPALEEKHRAFIAVQRIFFTATGTAQSRINVSPKGMDSLRILSERRVAYLDLTGSGNETGAHLTHDGRMTMMWCSFDADPLILRLYGRGRIVRRQDPEWGELRQYFTTLPSERQIIVLDIDSVQTSCGYAVPHYTYTGERETLARWAEKKGPVGLLDYWRTKNQVSIDGLPTRLLEDEE